MIDNGNFASRFIHNAQLRPDKLALHIPQMDGSLCVKEESISYGELANLVHAYQLFWQQKGFKEGDKVIVILKPNKDLYAIALSLFSLGLVPVFIDTGMGRKKIQMAIRDANAKAIISFTQLIKLFWFIPSLWRLQRYAIDGSGLGYQNLSLQVSKMKKVMEEEVSIQSELTCFARNEADHGLISFTSGSTGRPKGADRTHFSLVQQHLAIREHWPDQEGDIDCPCFPVMVLHNLSCGMTSILPKVDLAKPAGVDAALVIEQIRQYKITRLSGAPAYIKALVDYVNQQPEPHCSVKEIKGLVVGGATVSNSLALGIKQAFPMADGKIVYGSTEAEPISEISIDEYLAENDSAIAGSGYLVGHIASQVDLLITNSEQIKKEPITETELIKHRCEQGEIGEILVSGHHVLKQYIDNPEANRENKIPRDNVESTKSVWHRTGDCGYQDSQGRLWLSGRVKDTLQFSNQALQPYPLEQQLDQIHGMQRSAVIEIKGCVYVFIQCAKNNPDHLLKEQILREQLSSIVSAYFSSIGTASIQCVYIEKIPVDGRHNSKIDRPLLRELLVKNKIKGSQIVAL